MALLRCNNLQLAFGHVALLDHADFSLAVGERVGLIGRNGTGKSSLLRIVAGLNVPDDGECQRQQNLTSAFVAQEPQFDLDLNVFDAVASGLGERYRLLHDYDAAVSALEHTESEAALEHMHTLQMRMEETHSWDLQHRIDHAISRLSLPPHAVLRTLSGGMRKRVALAAALVQEPQLLILDEPTNHLDVDAITWLEICLCEYRGALLFVTHDRAFLDAVATRIVELDRGRLLSFPGNFSAYQTRKAEQLAQEEVERAKFDKLLSQEEIWVRKGVEARRTRSVSRIQRLEQLRTARAARRERVGQVALAVHVGDRSGKRVADLENVSKSYGAHCVVKNFNASIMRGDKIGLLGANGVGKTTVLKLILGELAPDQGQVKLGTSLQIAYFDQLRAQLNEDETLLDTISPGSEWIEIHGQRKHVMSYLGDFLFAPERAKSPVKSLSGGERNRLLLARLFALPANLLVLDEPTNDLDIETLELLENLLQDYPGTVLLVSHDRHFLNNVVTQTIVAEPSLGVGTWREYVGGYDDWLRQRAPPNADKSGEKNISEKNLKTKEKTTKGETTMVDTSPSSVVTAAKKNKLSYKEQRELEKLPSQIAALEAEQEAVIEQLSDSSLYAQQPGQARALQQRCKDIEEYLSQLLQRREKLESEERR